MGRREQLMPWNAVKQGMASTTQGTAYNALSGNLGAAVSKLGGGYRPGDRYSWTVEKPIEVGPNRMALDDLVAQGKLDERRRNGILSDAIRKYRELGGPELQGDFDSWFGQWMKTQGVMQ